ncbi:MAG: RraA family protein [Acidimicrobiia bacterium]
MELSVEKPERIGDRLEALYTGIIHDVLRSMGEPRGVLPKEIDPLSGSGKVGGVVFTMEGRPDPDISEHDSLLLWTEFLSEVPSGSVVLCQPNDAEAAHMGELSAETLQFRGVRGFVVDGGTRDTRFILDIEFPVWCRYTTPSDIVGRWRVSSLGAPIVIGGIGVETGDWVLADEDGVVVIPQRIAESVVTEAEIQMSTEDKIRAAILQGTSPKDAYLKFGKF